MKLTITGRHLDVTESVKNYAKDKLNGVIIKHSHARIIKAHVIMDKQKRRNMVEVELHGPNSNLCAKTAGDNMYASIDAVMGKIDRQLAKTKTKYDKVKHKHAPSIRNMSVETVENGYVKG